MRQHSRGRKGSQFIDPEFAEALYEDKSSHSSSDRQAERKAQQFCRQVQRALNLALADRDVGDGIDDGRVSDRSGAEANITACLALLGDAGVLATARSWTQVW